MSLSGPTSGPPLNQQQIAAREAAAAQYTAPATAPTPGASSGIIPSAGEVARVMSQETQTAQYVIQQTDVIEEAFAHILCRTALIYVFASVANGVLTDPAAAVYIGRTRQHLTEVRTDTTPVLLNDSATGDAQSARTYVRGTAGTIVLLQYR